MKFTFLDQVLTKRTETSWELRQPQKLKLRVQTKSIGELPPELIGATCPPPFSVKKFKNQKYQHTMNKILYDAGDLFKFELPIGPFYKLREKMSVAECCAGCLLVVGSLLFRIVF